MKKLIRDKVPELAAKEGDILTTEVLTPEAFQQALKEKLVEESLEVQHASQEDLLEELADCAELIHTIAAENQITLESLEEERLRKHDIAGGFTQKLLLIGQNNTVDHEQNNIDRPKVGVGVIVLRENKVLLGKRLNSHGSHTWNFPGGHLEYQEEIFNCATREVKEETGLNITNLELGPYTNDIFLKDNKHYITLFVIAHASTGEPQVMEPEKCVSWQWFTWDHLPKPLFLPITNLLKQNYDPRD